MADVVAVVLTFTYRTSMDAFTWSRFTSAQRVVYMNSMENEFHNNIDGITQEMIRDEQYEIKVREL